MKTCGESGGIAPPFLTSALHALAALPPMPTGYEAVWDLRVGLEAVVKN
jgi:hypothetical protein